MDGILIKFVLNGSPLEVRLLTAKRLYIYSCSLVWARAVLLQVNVDSKTRDAVVEACAAAQELDHSRPFPSHLANIFDAIEVSERALEVVPLDDWNDSCFRV